MPGTVTSIDLTRYSVGTFSGKVEMTNNTETGESSQLMSATVSVVGSSSDGVVTNSKGEFTLRDVLTFGNYPLYAEVSPIERNMTMSDQITSGYKHRFSFTPDSNFLSFPIQSVERVQSWKDQIPGISEQNGMVVAHIEHVKDAYSDSDLIPVIQPVFNHSSNEVNRADLSYGGAIVCSLSKVDRVQLPSMSHSLSGVVTSSSPFLQQDTNRVLGIELPENELMELKLIDLNGRKVFSSFVLGSRYVINSVTPVMPQSNLPND
jgi:hypothetical protein